MSRRSIQRTSRQRSRSSGVSARVQGAGRAIRPFSTVSGARPRKARIDSPGSTAPSTSSESAATTRFHSGASCSRSAMRCTVTGRGWSVATSVSTSTGIGSSDQSAPPILRPMP
ncbi:hypothetical protein [Variovorax paradoxus]|uniref:hypothetical protein n=1 Tax=Variovorax paradoxus TaxID=34073 RepID=UPI00247A3CC6